LNLKDGVPLNLNIKYPLDLVRLKIANIYPDIEKVSRERDNRGRYNSGWDNRVEVINGGLVREG
jgi:hypothetical protein